MKIAAAARGGSRLSARLYTPLYAGTAMGLCENVYRRGAVYWWRGRFSAQGAASRTVAVSLRTRDPDRARALDVKLTGMALRAREQVRTGAMSIGDVREHFIEAGPGGRFYFDPAVFNHVPKADRSCPQVWCSFWEEPPRSPAWAGTVRLPSSAG